MAAKTKEQLESLGYRLNVVMYKVCSDVFVCVPFRRHTCTRENCVHVHCAHLMSQCAHKAINHFSIRRHETNKRTNVIHARHQNGSVTKCVLIARKSYTVFRINRKRNRK